METVEPICCQGKEVVRLAESAVARVNFSFARPALFMDTVDVYVAARDGKALHVQLLGIQLAPVPDQDGTYVGQVVDKWVLEAETARELANQILAKLGTLTSEAEGAHGGQTP